MEKVTILIVILCLLAVGALLFFGINGTKDTHHPFEENGFVLTDGDNDSSAIQLPFTSTDTYTKDIDGSVAFQSKEINAKVPGHSFVCYEDGSIASFADGVLLNLTDLSDNFINNYYIPSGLRLAESGGVYMAETVSGTLNFGEHIVKISDSKYIIRAPRATIHFTDTDETNTTDFVQVLINKDGVAEITTEDNRWYTVSSNCYIETFGKVRVYPVEQLIENGTYKMSLAKLSVSPDDAIILTESETRRQIVPEINIETIDGEDGTDGSAGSVGAGGSNGEDGGDGTGGSDGIGGSSGSSGTAGMVGTTGTTGATGTSGVRGTGGDDGRNAVLVSTTNAALPVLKFVDFQPDSAGLRASISVTDESGFFGPIESVKMSYPATVMLTNEATGEQIVCYETTSLMYADTDANQPNINSVYTVPDCLYFATEEGVLDPDTLYRLSVVAYYEMNNTIYSREFLTRSFYTDSAGVVISQVDAGTSSLTVEASVLSGYEDRVSRAEVYLLTAAQNDEFSISHSGVGSFVGKYVLDFAGDEVGVTYVNADGVPGTTETRRVSDGLELDYTGLTSDCNFVGRVVVTHDDYLSLTNQKLEMSTLKTPPSWDISDKPLVSYNRTTGAIEVMRPLVTDSDNGAMKYIYTAYTGSGSDTTVVATRELASGAAEPAIFYLPAGEEYSFNVTMEFDDNEKTVVYDLGTSWPFSYSGGNMPKVTLERSVLEFNSMEGNVLVTFNENTAPQVDPLHPLTLTVYADQVAVQTLQITGENTTAFSTVNGVSIGDATYSYSNNASGKNYGNIALHLHDLKLNTDYGITVGGYLNVGDGNDYMEFPVIGSVSFRTKDTTDLVASYSAGPGGTTISQYLTLGCNDAYATEQRREYAINEVVKGSVVLEIWKGSGSTARCISTVTLDNSTKEEYLSQMTRTGKYEGGEGLLINEGIFGSLNLESSENYTLKIVSVTDETYKLPVLGYTNEFLTVRNPNKTITGSKTPPPLINDPENGVLVTPILNKDSGKYTKDGKTDDSLPEDAVVGYLLEANYINSERIGYDLTYYAMEYSAYYKTLVERRIDPMRDYEEGAGNSGTRKLMKVTLPFDSTSDNPPKLALLFGGDKDESDGTFIGSADNGYYVCYTGEVQQQGDNVFTGMDRGYRYVFAYTARYSSDGSFDDGSLLYYPANPNNPTDTPVAKYTLFRDAYGAGKQYDLYLGNAQGGASGVAYILNSGMIECPRILPTFHTYQYATSNTQVQNHSNPESFSNGRLTIHYKWEDPDNTIAVSTEGGRTITTISFVNENDTTSTQPVNKYPVSAGETEWYSITLPYSCTNGDDDVCVIRPKVNIDNYKVNYYKTIMKEFLGDEEGETVDDYYMGEYTADWAYGDFFSDSNNSKSIQVELDTTQMTQNKLVFSLVDVTSGSNLRTMLANRAYALQVILTINQGRTDSESRTYYLPIDIQEIDATNALCTATLNTGLLPVSFQNKKITYTATVLYDNGDQGWKLAEDVANYVGLQFISDNVTGEPKMDRYIIPGRNGRTTSTMPSNGLLKPSATGIIDALQNTVRGDNEKLFTKASMSFEAFANGLSGSIGAIHLFPMANGTDLNIYSDVQFISYTYAVPKGCSQYTLKNAGTNSFTLDMIVPIIVYDDYSGSQTRIGIHPFKVTNIDQADMPIVYARLYANEGDVYDNNNKLTENYVPGQELAINISTTSVNEYYPTSEDADNMAFTGLPTSSSSQIYYLVFYTVINGEKVPLLDSITAEREKYEVFTSDGVIIRIPKDIVYINDAYLDKEISFTYTLTRYYNVTMHYDIYQSIDDAETTIRDDSTGVLSNTPYMSSEELFNLDLLNAPTTSASYSNVFALSLSPSSAREKLKPGNTYYLRISGTEGLIEVGSAVFPFTIDSLDRYGAAVYVPRNTVELKGRTNSSGDPVIDHETGEQYIDPWPTIEFQVTI